MKNIITYSLDTVQSFYVIQTNIARGCNEIHFLGFFSDLAPRLHVPSGVKKKKASLRSVYTCDFWCNFCCTFIATFVASVNLLRFQFNSVPTDVPRSLQFSPKLHEVSNMFETSAISWRQIAASLHLRFSSRNSGATKVAYKSATKIACVNRPFLPNSS